MNVISSEAANPELPASNADTTSVGASLRLAREKQGLTVADVADTLRFSARQIEAIEADRYDNLPGATFVRGLVRGYAKFVRIDGEFLVNRLQLSVPAPVSDVRPPTTIADAAEHTPAVAALSPRLLMSGMIFALTVGGALYAITALDFDQATAVSAPSNLSNPVTAPVVSPEASPPSAPAQATGVEVVSPINANPGAPVVLPETAQLPPINLPGLVVEFDDRSWIEVRDASQSVVLSGEFSKGVKQEVTGAAPFQLWIGRASVVRVSYRGAAVDVKARTREDVARLTVE